MGKLVTYLSILIFMDLFFILTGQVGQLSVSSLILNLILNLVNYAQSGFYEAVFSLATGIGSLAVTVGVVSGIINKSGIELLAFIGIGLSLLTLTGDFISIFNYLYTLNNVLAIVIMSPLVILYMVTILEWVRGKD